MHVKKIAHLMQLRAEISILENYINIFLQNRINLSLLKHKDTEAHSII